MDYFVKVFLPRALQDGAVALAGYLALHGVLPEAQKSAFVGSVFFLGMLLVNAILAKFRKDKAAVSGGMAVAAVTSDVPNNKEVVKQIIAESKK